MSHDLIDTLETDSEFDALAKLQPGEPYFLLLGRDRLAPDLVQKWADANRERALTEYGEGKINEEKRDRELRKSTQAEAKGWSMQSFKAGDMVRKVTEQPTIKTYTGAEVPEATKRADRMYSLRRAAANALNNAVAGCAELLDEIAIYGDPGELAQMVTDLDLCKASMIIVADLVNPVRVPGMPQATALADG